MPVSNRAEVNEIKIKLFPPEALSLSRGLTRRTVEVLGLKRDLKKKNPALEETRRGDMYIKDEL